MTRPFRQVDVFTARLGLGNPVAVVHDAQGLSDVEMAAFARWTNLSETTFLLPPTLDGADYRVRIFTPSEELPFAGHPTLGTCHAWLEARGAPHASDRIVQECGVGAVPLRRRDGRLAFATPPLLRSGAPTADELGEAREALGLQRDDVVAAEWIDNGPGWLGLLLADAERVGALRPTLGPAHKIGVAALTPDDPRGTGLVVRAFFHAGGATREDPVTGSLNGSLAQWLLGAGYIESPYVASQGTALQRDGRVHVDADGDEIWIAGDTVTGMVGFVEL